MLYVLEEWITPEKLKENARDKSQKRSRPTNYSVEKIGNDESPHDGKKTKLGSNSSAQMGARGWHTVS